MKHTYKVIGMTCQHCAQKVHDALMTFDEIKQVEISYASAIAEIQMSKHIAASEINKKLKTIGDYRLQEMQHPINAKHEDHLTHADKHINHQNHEMNKEHRHSADSRIHHKTHDGHEGHHDHHKGMLEDFKIRFWVSLILTIPILVLSPMIQDWLNLDIRFSGDRLLLFGLSTAIYFYGGWPFLKGLFDELSKRAPGMMTLIAIAISAAYLYSSAVVFGLEGKTFFWELATLIVVMLIGHWLEMKSVLGASKALEALAALMPDTAHLVEGYEVREVKVDALNSGDIILIKPGEKVPADGKIIEGESDLNESMLTGESVPVKKSIGEEVIGGSINGSGSVKVEVKGIGEETYLSKVVKMVSDAQGQKSKTQRLADRAAYWLTILALVIGFGTFAVWIIKGKTLAFALERMVTVMVICCPHALGLAIPLVAAISTSRSAKNGLLIRNRTAFESARQISTIVFDKTGTLTKGSHEVTRVVSLNKEYSQEDIIKYAASLESPSEHHIAKGLRRKAQEQKIELYEVSEFKSISGVGVSGIVNNKQVQAGGFLQLEKLNITPPKDVDEGIETKVFTIVDDKLIGFVTFADEIRPSAFEAIKTIQKSGIKVSLLTGDNKEVAEEVSIKLGMDDFQAEVLPEEKLKKIKILQDTGEFVAMIGDGVNDAPALAQADIGIAIGSGTDVAAETADIILVDSDPKDISNLIFFGKATYRKMVQNLIWATGYNIIAVPLATGFIPGLIISPAFGAALMSLSTIICAVNAQLLKTQLKL